MEQKITKFIGVVLLIAAAPHLSVGQYFQRLRDIDSSQDWGVNIFLQAGGNYFVKGTFFSTISNWALFTMQVTADGNTALSKHTLQYDTANLYGGNPGDTKALTWGGYIAPLTIQTPDHITGYLHSATGLIKYNGSGDTIFTKTYTDTSIYFEEFITCAVMPDGGYILGGSRALNTPSAYPGLLICTDSMGDTLWTHTYQNIDTQMVQIINILPLADGRIVAAAMSSYQVIIEPSGVTYNHNVPWFLVLDNMGNILKDTAYNNTYMVGANLCGSLYNDMNGGYIQIGILNTYDAADPYSDENFPAYIAHLDTNFRVTWITNFIYSSTYGHRQGDIVRQLRDSSYAVVGEATGPFAPSTQGFAAKLSKTGAIMWSKNYYSDTTQFAYFLDMVEKPDGGLVFVGKTFNDTCAAWKDHGDVWLVNVDSNGYLPPDTTTQVHVLPPLANAVTIYPNPTNGNFIITCPQEGAIVVYNVQGQFVASYKIKAGATCLQLSAATTPGMYICKYIPAGGNNVPTVVRLVYAP